MGRGWDDAAVVTAGSWTLDLDLRVLPVNGSDVGVWAALLDEDEVARSARFRLAADRRRFILGRGLLRVMVGEAANRPPRALRFDATPEGKPTLAGADDLAFNVAHSGDYVMVAVAEARAIGVDIEKHRPDFDLLALSERVFGAAEHRIVAEAAEGQRTRIFFRQWVFKEAFLKGLGTGFSIDPKRYDIGAAAPGVASSVTPAAEGERLCAWQLHEVAIADDYSAAVAILP